MLLLQGSGASSRRALPRAPHDRTIAGCGWARRWSRSDDTRCLGTRSERVEDGTTQRVGRDALADGVGGVDGDPEPGGLRGDSCDLGEFRPQLVRRI